MNILALANLGDIYTKILGKSILDITIENLQKSHNLKIYSKFVQVRQHLNSELLYQGVSLKDVLQRQSNDSEDSFILITKLAISNIDYSKLLLYHKNHGEKITLVCRNLAKGKVVPLYKLNNKKEIISTNKKRYVGCGIYIFNKSVDFSNLKTISSLIEDYIDRNEIRAFVHTGYFYRTQQRVDNVNYIVKKRKTATSFIGGK